MTITLVKQWAKKERKSKNVACLWDISCGESYGYLLLNNSSLLSSVLLFKAHKVNQRIIALFEATVITVYLCGSTELKIPWVLGRSCRYSPGFFCTRVKPGLNRSYHYCCCDTPAKLLTQLPLQSPHPIGVSTANCNQNRLCHAYRYSETV